MRIFTQLKLRRFGRGPHGGAVEVHVTTQYARDYVQSLLAASSWAPEDSLLKPEFEQLLQLARDDTSKLKNAENEERTLAVEALGIERHKVSLAANILDLLVQMQHGVKLESLSADQLLAIHDAHSGCWGMVVVDRSSIQLRVRSGAVTVLREATEDILSVLQVREPSSLGRRRRNHGEEDQFLEAPEMVSQFNRSGEPEATGKVHVVNGFGLVAYAAWQPAPRALLGISGALVLLSLFSVLAVTGNPALAVDPWITWGHATLDRVFTGTLGAALVVVVTTVRLLQGQRRRRGPRVLIRWDEASSS